MTAINDDRIGTGDKNPRRHPGRRIALGVALSVLGAAILLGVFSCSALGLRPWNRAPSASDYVGTWQSSDPDMRIVVDASREITFYNIPIGALEYNGERVWDKTPVTVSGKWDDCWDYGYLVQCGYSLPSGYDGKLESEGNVLTGYTISLVFGPSYDRYEFHRIDTGL